MKLLHTVPLAALTAAIVLPDAHVFEQLNAKAQNVVSQTSHVKSDVVHDLERFLKGYREQLQGAWSELSDKATDAVDDAVFHTADEGSKLGNVALDSFSDAKSWLDSTSNSAKHQAVKWHEAFEEPPHDEPPHHGPPHHGPPHHGPPHHGPPHHCKPEKTVYELIASSKYTTKLAKLLDDYPDLVKTLNGTKANYTVFAPTDFAFAKIPEHAPKPPKQVLEAVLMYHVSPQLYSAGRILTSRTIPTLLQSDQLGDKPLPQRLATQIGFRGLTVNFYSRVIAVNIFGTNGVIHGVDSLIVPPPEALDGLQMLPTEFSTLDLALTKTGLLDELLKAKHKGSTIFAPSNFAFAKLGPGLNAFLFSPYGLKYLKALLKYHVVHNQTVYSDEYYPASSEDEQATGIPKGTFHYQLPTLLDGKELAVDIARYGRLIEIKLNAFFRVSVSDGVAKDGVVHAISSILFPPKTGGHEQREADGEMSKEELIERLEPMVEDAHVNDL